MFGVLTTTSSKTLAMLSQRWFSRLDAGASHSLWQPLLTSDVWNDLSDEFAKARRASDAKSPEIAAKERYTKDKQKVSLEADPR